MTVQKTMPPSDVQKLIQDFENSNYFYTAVQGIVNSQGSTQYEQAVMAQFAVLIGLIKEAIQKVESALISSDAKNVSNASGSEQISKLSTLLSADQQQATNANDLASNNVEEMNDVLKRLADAVQEVLQFFTSVSNAWDSLSTAIGSH